MSRLIFKRWDWDAPCHTHGCDNRIAWRIVPDELGDITAAVVAGLCDECKESLVRSGLPAPTRKSANAG